MATLATSFAQDCSNLFISEYVEGWSNNKALEIYNPTDNVIDLSQYFVMRVRDGLGFGSVEAKNCIQLTGTIQPKSTHVGVVDLRDPAGTGQTAPVWSELQALADEFYCPTYTVNNTWYWNGNDAVALFKGTAANPQNSNNVLVDILGKHNQPTSGGWSTVAPYNGSVGEIVTVDHGLIRKSSIKRGLTITEATATNYVFNPLEQWDSIPAVLPKYDEFGQLIYNQAGNLVVVGNWSTLGWHACECDPASVGVQGLNLDNIKLYPNPTTGNFTISGLEKVDKIEVYNSLGQEITTIVNNTQSSVSFDFSEKSGVYMVTITDLNGRSATQKVIVK